MRCPICKCEVPADHTFGEMDGWTDTCSPECARTKAIVDAIKGIEIMLEKPRPYWIELSAHDVKYPIYSGQIKPSERTQ